MKNEIQESHDNDKILSVMLADEIETQRNKKRNVLKNVCSSLDISFVGGLQ